MYHCLIVVHAVHKMNKFTNNKNKCNKKQRIQSKNACINKKQHKCIIH